MIIENRRDEGVRIHHDIVPTIRAAWGTGGNVSMILDDEKYGIEMYSMANGSHTLEKYGTDISPTLTSRMGTGGNQVPVFVVNKNKANTLRANAGAIKHMEDLKGRTVVENTAYSFDSLASNSMKSKNPNSGCREVDVSKTVDTSDPNPSKNQGGIGIVTKSYAVAQNQRGECRTDENKSYALTATDGSRSGQSRPCVVEGVNYQGCKSASNTFKDICPTLEATHGHDVHVIKQDSYCIAGNTIDLKVENGGNGAGFQKDISYTLNTIDRHSVTESRIRRLTPLECERLQGLPDNWTDVPSVDHKGNIKPASDSSRYKAIGNGMSQPCADFVLRQIAYYAQTDTFQLNRGQRKMKFKVVKTGECGDAVRLYNGDCLDILKSIPDNSIDLVVTDPPYVIETKGAGIYKQADKQYVKELAGLKDGFSPNVLDELCRVMKKINCYFFCSQKQIIPLLQYFVGEKNCNYNLLSWHKTNPVPACGNKYLTDTEFILFFREKGVRLYGEFKTKRTFYITPLNQKDKKLYKHPTCKPVEILRNLIINSSLENDVVLDPFLGSGSTGVACKNTARKFIGIEINKEYFNIAKERIDKEMLCSN